MLRKRLIAFCRADRGGASTEFALTAPMILLVIIGSIEIMMTLFIMVAMEGGLREASRYGITGAETPAAREQQILDILDTHTYGFVDFDTAEVETLIYPDFASIGEPEPFQDDPPFDGQYSPGESYTDINGNGQWDDDMGIPGVGIGDEILLYRITYDWPMLTGYISGLVGETITLSASMAVRNEPF